MAYYTTYRCKAFNRTNQLIEILFQQKLTLPDNMEVPEIVEVPLLEFTCEYFSGNEEKYDPTIISQKATIKLRAEYGSGSSINAEMLYADAYDEWKVIATVDEKTVFVGFVTMENEPYIMKMKPYDIVVTATDGLGLLKNIELTDYNGVKFTGRNTLYSYLTGALKKTNLLLDLQIYCNIFNDAHLNRFDIGGPDMFTQTKLHHRSFLKDAATFLDCYSAIEFMLKNWCVLYQWNGAWVINNLLEMQHNLGPQRYYTSYGVNTGIYTFLDTTNAATIGKNNGIQSINLDQYVSYQYPIKSVKSSYKYEIPDNLVNNQKLQDLGSFISPIGGSEVDPASGDYVGQYLGFEKVGWSNYSPTYININPYTGYKKSYIKKVNDSFGTEIDRYYVIEYDSTVANGIGFRIVNDNTDFFIDKGDVITISFQVRWLKDFNFSNNPHGFASIDLLRSGYSGSSTSHWYTSNPSGRWTNTYNASAFRVQSSVDNREWTTVSVTTYPAPDYGVIFLSLGPGPVNDNSNEVHIKEISIEYKPYVKGSTLNVKGDYWKTEQTTNIKDIIEDEVTISESQKRIFKGALWSNDGLTLASRNWYYFKGNDANNSTYYELKEIMNLGRYRHQYRRQKRINGSFKGVMWRPDGGSNEQFPLAFHRHYKIENDSKTYMLSAPLKIDYVKSQWRGTLIETGISSTDYNNVGDTHLFNYTF